MKLQKPIICFGLCALFIACSAICSSSYAKEQSPVTHSQDSIPKNKIAIQKLRDSIGHGLDSAKLRIKRTWKKESAVFQNKTFIKGKIDSSPNVAGKKSIQDSSTKSKFPRIPSAFTRLPKTIKQFTKGNERDSSQHDSRTAVRNSDSTSQHVDTPKTAAKKIWEQTSLHLREKILGSVPGSGIWNGSFSKRHTDSAFKKGVQFSVPKFTPVRHFVQFNGGYLNYNYSYRTNMDTPILEKQIGQHQVIANFRVSIADRIPLIVNAYFRRSNSAYFKDITDLQVQFDALAYRNQVMSNLRKRFAGQFTGKQDSLLNASYFLKQAHLRNLTSWLTSQLTQQKLIEAHEMLNVPRKAYDMHLPDSTNQKRSDSVQQHARQFLVYYEKTRGEQERLSKGVDSLHAEYEEIKNRIQKYKQFLNGPAPGYAAMTKWDHETRDAGSGSPGISSGDRWLMGLRSFGVGRNSVNSSELTAKNISLTGVHFEYNSWYILGLSAGLVDYRFRDFIVRQLQTPQYLYMIRVGIGHLESNYFLVSAFHGQKQIFASGSGTGNLAAIKTNGIALESKWTIRPGTYLLGEVAQSISPDFRNTPAVTKTRFDFSDKTNKAVSLKLYAYLPRSFSRLDVQYKYTGANFQSFNSFQTNAAQKSWSVRVEQPFFHRKLRLLASLRSNDFSNPYIVQNYKSNTIFKTLSATFQSRGWPTVSVAYMPMTQLTMLGNNLAENRFQTLNASVSHFYKIGIQQTATNIVYTKLFNTSSDTGFIYFNSVNLYIGQTFFFRHLTTNLAISHSQSPNYQYNVIEQGYTLQLSRQGSIGGGVKINNLNRVETKLGGYANSTFALTPKDVLHVHLEQSYFPGNGNRLVQNILGNISYTRSIH